MSLLDRARHLHFMGIGGVGMCALAELLLGQGFTISGCDLAASERTERLARLGAAIAIGHDAAHLAGADGLVITAAVAAGHAERAAAEQAGLPVISRAALLGELLQRYQGVAVAGTHGKTTTTSMIAFLLSEAGLDPTVVAGGRMRFLESHARLGQGPVMVCEADEFDRSFLELTPAWVVITNVEPEHLDCYGSLEALEQAFVTLANRVPASGAVIACADDPAVARLLPQITARTVTYGSSATADLRAVTSTAGTSGSELTVATPEQRLGRILVPMTGAHNVLNALAAIAVGRELGVPFAELQSILPRFPGVARRCEILGERDGVMVVDDYAHHPTEVAAALAAVRQGSPQRRLVAVFQPHLYSRTRDHAAGFGQALLAAEVAVVLPVYPAREEPLPGVNAGLVSAAARRAGHQQVIDAGSFAHARAVLGEQLRDGDLLLTLGAGDVFQLAQWWLGDEPC